jgi:hypothetical protein
MRRMGMGIVPVLFSMLFSAIPLGLAVVVFMTLIRIRNAAEETNRRLAAIEAKLSRSVL